MILAENDATYARLQFHAGPGGSIRLLTEIDFDRPFAGTDVEQWENEYRTHVRIRPIETPSPVDVRKRRCQPEEAVWIHE